MNAIILVFLVLIVILVLIAVGIGVYYIIKSSRTEKTLEARLREDLPVAPDETVKDRAVETKPPYTSSALSSPSSYPFKPQPSSASLSNLDEMKIKPPDLNPINVLVRAVQADMVKHPAPEDKSIVMQIDEILQERLEGSPLKQRGIRLAELPDKSMAVWVGLEKYTGVDAVPDEEIKELIRLCVAEWERRSAKS